MIDTRLTAAFAACIALSAGAAMADEDVVSTARTGPGAPVAPQTPAQAPAPTTTPKPRHGDSVDAAFLAAANRASERSHVFTGGQVSAAVGTGGYRAGSIDAYAVKPGSFALNVHLSSERGRGLAYPYGYLGTLGYGPYGGGYANPLNWGSSALDRPTGRWSGWRPIDKDNPTDASDEPTDTVTPPSPGG